MAATSPVLETTELLEMILLQLPIQDVLLSQRVCTLWHSTIINSIQLQRALFLRPAQESTTPTTTLQPITLNTPCTEIITLPGRKTLIPSIFHLKGTLKTGFAYHPGNHHTTSSSSSSSSFSSWRKMYLTQPPITREILIGNYIPDPTSNFGELPRLGAVQSQAANGIKLEHSATALEQEVERFGKAKLKGKEYRFWCRSSIDVQERGEMIKSALLEIKQVERDKQLEAMRLLPSADKHD